MKWMFYITLFVAAVLEFFVGKIDCENIYSENSEALDITESFYHD